MHIGQVFYTVNQDVCASVCSVVFYSWPQGLQPARLLCPWDSPGTNPGVGCHFLLQETFPTRIRLASLVSPGTGMRIFYPCASWEAPRLGNRISNLRKSIFFCRYKELILEFSGHPIFKDSDMLSDPIILTFGSENIILILIINGPAVKSRKSRNTWSNRQIWPGNTE